MPPQHSSVRCLLGFRIVVISLPRPLAGVEATIGKRTNDERLFARYRDTRGLGRTPKPSNRHRRPTGVSNQYPQMPRASTFEHGSGTRPRLSSVWHRANVLPHRQHQPPPRREDQVGLSGVRLPLRPDRRRHRLDRGLTTVLSLGVATLVLPSLVKIARPSASRFSPLPVPDALNNV